jgi:hypothetical protein
MDMKNPSNHHIWTDQVLNERRLFCVRRHVSHDTIPKHKPLAAY